MNLALPRISAVLLTVLLQSCGGGGGGDGDGSGSGSDARLSISASSVSASSTPGDLAPQRTVTLTITNNPPPVVYIDYDYSASGIDRVEFAQTAPAQGELRIFFRSAGSLLNATYDDTVDVRVCLDDLCQTDLRGSPRTIRTSYVVSGSGPTSATISRSTIALTVDHREQGRRREAITATLNALPPSGVHINMLHTSNAVEFAAQGAPGLVTDMLIGFVAGRDRPIGSYDDTVTVKVCYDNTCVRQVTGSPFTVATTMNVTLGEENGLPQLDVLSRTPLGHDVIDAEYSGAMNAIVMVGGYPQPAIHVFDLDTGVASQQALAMVPTAVAISPDGLTAAVGHNARISLVDLQDVGTPGAPAPVLLNVSIPVYDVALDDGNVFAVPAFGQGDSIHAVDIASNTEQLVQGFLERMRLRPGTSSLYAIDNIPPNDLSKWDVSSGVPSFLYGSPDQGSRDACHDFWFSQPGDRIFTGCGATFSANADPGQDLLYSGSMPLTAPTGRGDNYIRSLSHSAPESEIALIEWNYFDCLIGPLYRPCYTRLAYYDDAFYSRTAIYAIGPVTTGGAPYAQRGLYVFHDPQSGRKYLIGELEGSPSPDQKYWLSIIQ